MKLKNNPNDPINRKYWEILERISKELEGKEDISLFQESCTPNYNEITPGLSVLLERYKK